MYKKQLAAFEDGDMWCWYFAKEPKPSKEPTTRVGGCWWRRGQLLPALPYHLEEILRLNTAIDARFKVVTKKSRMIETDGAQDRGLLFGAVANSLEFLTGSVNEFASTSGFVEFKSLTAKQTALQCNLVGTSEAMSMTSAPDPRDIIWDNILVDRKVINSKTLIATVCLVFGVLFWSSVVAFVSKVPERLNPIETGKESALAKVWGNFVRAVLPVIVSEGLTKIIPKILQKIGRVYIRFKKRSNEDRFVLLWHFIFRLFQILMIIISGTLYDFITKDFAANPLAALRNIASNMNEQSQYFVNYLIVYTGIEVLFELAQGFTMVHYWVTYQITTLESKSMRSLKKLNKAPSFQYGDVLPLCIYPFMITVIYHVTVPIISFFSALCFYISTKVYTHQALLICAQKYEGGGLHMYMLNTLVFILLYVSIIILTFYLLIRNEGKLYIGVVFVSCIFPIVLYVDVKIKRRFVFPSQTLSLARARALDEENLVKEETSRKYREYKAEKEMRKKIQKAKEKKGKSTEATKTIHGDNRKKNVAPMLQMHALEKPGTEFDHSQAINGIQNNRKKNPQEQSLLVGDKMKVKKKDMKDDYFVYRQPSLNRLKWETKPQPYR
mmetsp:Transcript_41498/g.81344  ORF Transcript_41498/g.81344 Transcript_41498/m.81344 type:complete len:610 (-) Transcript_41498:238-2067(-)